MPNNLRVENLSKSYKNKVTVNDVSLYLERGESIALLGPNGAGKTTCFKIIVGLVKANYGNLYLDNLNITNLPIHKRGLLGISYLPQELSVFRGLTVSQNIMAVLEIINCPVNSRKSRLDQLLEEFSLNEFSNVKATLLSGGLCRRLEIARTVATNPNFILLDEPLAGIDPIAMLNMRTLIMNLQKKNIGILITDHNVRATLSMVNRVYIIYNGKILLSGNAKDIVNNEKVQEVYLGKEFEEHLR